MDEENENGNENENENEEQNNQNSGGSSRNSVYNRAKNRQAKKENKAKKLEQKSNKAQNKSNKLSEKSSNQAGQNKNFRANLNNRRAAHQGKKSQKLAKKAEKAQKQAKKAEKFAKIAAKIGKIIATVGWIILIIMIIVGLLVFVLAGLGMIWDAIQNILNGIGDYFASTAVGEELLVKDNDISDVLVNLQEMGYDLYGYGFTTYLEPLKESENNQDADVETDENGDIDTSGSGDEDESRLRWDGKNFGYNLIRLYLVSDNYSSILKNDNHNYRTMFTHMFDDQIWGSGLISLYYDTGTIGERGDSQLDGWIFDNGVNAKISKGKLVLKSSSFSSVNFEYDLDGWIGRYGMPLEFLLSTHIATMAPDLPVRLATSFETDVEILLHKSTGGNVKGGIASKDDPVNTPLDDKILTSDTDFDNTMQVFRDAKKKGIAIESPDSCNGPETQEKDLWDDLDDDLGVGNSEYWFDSSDFNTDKSDKEQSKDYAKQMIEKKRNK